MPKKPLIQAEYAPRKKLKPGDSEFKKIKNSINFITEYMEKNINYRIKTIEKSKSLWF